MTASDRLWKRRQVLSVAAAGAAGVAVAACGGGTNNGTTNTKANRGTTGTTKGTSSPAGSGPSPAQSKQQPHKGGTLRVAQVGDILFNSVPWLNDSAPLLIWTVFEPVVRYRHSLTPELVLLDKFEYNPDRTQLTMSLLPNLAFHDGSPVTADDIIFAVNLIKNPQKYGASATQLSGFASFITQVKRVDDRTVQFTFDRPRGNMNDFFAQLLITKAATYPELLKGKNVQGTGPYKFVSWQPGQGFSLAANNNWHGTAKEGGPYLNGIDVKLFADTTAIDLAMQSGSIDLTQGGITASDAVKYRATHQVYVEPPRGLSAIFINVSSPPLNDKRVRQALGYALDRERIQKEVFYGFVPVKQTPWPNSSPAYDASLEKPLYNPQKAKSLLKEAGFSQSGPVPLSFPSGGSTTLEEIVQQNYAAVGFNVKLVPEDLAAWRAQWIARKLSGMWVYGVSFTEMSPVTYLQQSLAMRVGSNPEYFVDPAYATIEKQLESLEPASSQAKDLYKQFNAMWFDEPWVISYVSQSTITVAGKNVRGAGDYFITVFHQMNYASLWKTA